MFYPYIIRQERESKEEQTDQEKNKQANSKSMEGHETMPQNVAMREKNWDIELLMRWEKLMLGPQDEVLFHRRNSAKDE